VIIIITVRNDRYNHEEFDDESDDDIMMRSFSSCSPRYKAEIYGKFHESKVRLDIILGGIEDGLVTS